MHRQAAIGGFPEVSGSEKGHDRSATHTEGADQVDPSANAGDGTRSFAGTTAGRRTTEVRRLILAAS